MRFLLAPVLLAATAVLAQPLDGGSALSASELIAQASERYEADDWQQAADRFKAAFDAAPGLGVAHYRFAATVFRALEGDGCHELSYPRSEAIDHLATSLRLDPALRTRLEGDPDFARFRETASYHALLGTDLRSAKGLAAVLPRLRLRAPTVSDSGPLFTLQFHAGGAVDVLDRELSNDGWTWVKRVGTWRVEPAVIDGKRALVLVLKALATKSVPAIQYSGVVTVGPVVLRFETGKDGRAFASDEWIDCR